MVPMEPHQEKPLRIRNLSYSNLKASIGFSLDACNKQREEITRELNKDCLWARYRDTILSLFHCLVA